jgi:hypothetical protein
MFGGDIETAGNLKIILCTFKHLTGLKNNYPKSDFLDELKKARKNVSIYSPAKLDTSRLDT